MLFFSGHGLRALWLGFANAENFFWFVFGTGILYPNSVLGGFKIYTLSWFCYLCFHALAILVAFRKEINFILMFLASHLYQICSAIVELDMFFGIFFIYLGYKVCYLVEIICLTSSKPIICIAFMIVHHRLKCFVLQNI